MVCFARKLSALYPGQAYSATALKARHVYTTPQHLRVLLPFARSLMGKGPKKSRAVNWKGRGAENGYIWYKIYRTNCLPLDSLGLGNRRNLSYCPIVGQLVMQMFRQCCVHQFNGWTVLCSIVKILNNALSNCPMVGQCCVRQSNGWSMLCPTIRWLVS